jgi:hypothetical protein
MNRCLTKAFEGSKLQEFHHCIVHVGMLQVNNSSHYLKFKKKEIFGQNEFLENYNSEKWVEWVDVRLFDWLTSIWDGIFHELWRSLGRDDSHNNEKQNDVDIH